VNLVRLRLLMACGLWLFLIGSRTGFVLVCSGARARQFVIRGTMAESSKSDSGKDRSKRDTIEKMRALAKANTPYESGLIPLLWLAIPFAAVLIYAIVS
jgi:hypothetical protein